MESLNLPEYTFTFSEKSGKRYILDEIRKKYILLTPEEWVRQNFVKYLIAEKQYPQGLISLEFSFTQNKLSRRSDILIYNSAGEPLMLVECKAPSIKISQMVFDQAAGYNMQIKAQALIITNGLSHYCCLPDPINRKWIFLPEIPNYEALKLLNIN